jgi:hypothetical protein
VRPDDLELVAVADLVPRAAHARGLPPRAGDVVQREETVGVAAVEGEVALHRAIAVVGVDEDEVDGAEGGAEALVAGGVGVAAEAARRGRQGDRQAALLGPAVVAGGDELEGEEAVQRPEEAAGPDADLEVGADRLGLDELAERDELLAVLEDAVRERLAVGGERGLGGAVPAALAGELGAEVAFAHASMSIRRRTAR